MKINGIGYVFQQGFKSIYKNKMFSLASIGTMAACIFLFGVFFSVILNFKNIVAQVESGVAITVFFEEGISEEEIQDIGAKLEKREEVSSVNYVSAEAAWEQFKTEYFGDKPELADAFTDDNPLANSANYQVFLSDVEKQKELVDYAKSMDGVRQVKSSEQVATTLSSFNILLGYVTAAIVIILMAVSIFLISNTVMIGIAVRKEEIAIMKLMGATDLFVKAPFIIEGITIGLIGSVVPLAILRYFYGVVSAYMTEKILGLGNWLTFIVAGEVFEVLVPVSLCLGVGIGFLGSYITLRKHLRV